MANTGKLAAAIEKALSRIGARTEAEAVEKVGERRLQEMVEAEMSRPPSGAGDRIETPLQMGELTNPVREEQFGHSTSEFEPDKALVPYRSNLPAVIDNTPGPGDFGPERPIRVNESRAPLRDNVEMSLDQLPPGVMDRPSGRAAAAGALGATGAGAALYNKVYGEERAQADAPKQETDETVASSPVSSQSAEAEQGGVDEKVPSLAETVNSNIPLPEMPSLQQASSKELMDATDKYIEELQRISQRDAVDTSDLQQQLRDARKEYRENRKKNEFLEALQLVATAFGSLAGSLYGQKHGRYIGDRINVGQIDYSKRTDLDRRELGDTTEDIRAEEARRFKQDEAAYRRDLDAAAGLKERISANREVYEQKQDAFTTEYREKMDAYIAAQREILQAEEDAKRTGAKEVDTVRAAGTKLVDDAGAQLGILGRLERDLVGPKAIKGLEPEDIISRAEDEGLLTQEEADAAVEKGGEGEVFYTDADKKKVLVDVIRGKLAARRQQLGQEQEIGKQMYLTGKRPEQPVAGKQKTIRSKSTGETRPYSADLWKNIQGSDKKNDFEIVEQ